MEVKDASRCRSYFNQAYSAAMLSIIFLNGEGDNHAKLFLTRRSKMANVRVLLDKLCNETVKKPLFSESQQRTKSRWSFTNQAKE
jgi:hypothetical protein